MNEQKISAGTITRTVLLAIALANQVLSTLGYSILPIDNEVVEQVITIGFTATMSIINWWKNNSITKKAIAADVYKQELNCYCRQERE